MNHDANVRRDTFEKVQRAAEKLGYEFPEIERRPVREQSVLKEKSLAHGRIAFLIPDRTSEGFDTELSKELSHGICDHLFDKRIEVVKVNFDEDGGLPEELKKKKIDGIIIRGAVDDSVMAPNVIEQIKRFPRVYLLWNAVNDESDCILYDHEMMGRNAARALHDRGRKQLAVVSFNEERNDYSMATSAFTNEAQSLGLEVKAFTARLYNHEEVTDEHMKDWQNFIATLDSTDGLFFNGSLEQCKKRFKGMEVPKPRHDFDVVISHQNEESAQKMLKQGYISSISKPFDLGKAAAEQLLWRISKPKALYRRTMISMGMALPKKK